MRAYQLPSLLAAVLVAAAVCMPVHVLGSADGQSTAPYRFVDFATLINYTYNPKAPFDAAPPRAVGTIPAEVRALHGQKIRITGNAMALDYSSGFMTEFILNTSVDNCAFGADPRINEWIYVKMAPGQKARIYTGIQIEVRGTFQVREEIEGGLVVGLYSMVGDSTK